MCITSAILTPICLSEPWTLIEEDKPTSTIVEVKVLGKTQKEYLLVEHKTTENVLKKRKVQSVLGKVGISNNEWADPDCGKLS
jgi:hypothetical protein